VVLNGKGLVRRLDFMTFFIRTVAFLSFTSMFHDERLQLLQNNYANKANLIEADLPTKKGFLFFCRLA